MVSEVIAWRAAFSNLLSPMVVLERMDTSPWRRSFERRVPRHWAFDHSDAFPFTCLRESYPDHTPRQKCIGTQCDEGKPSSSKVDHQALEKDPKKRLVMDVAKQSPFWTEGPTPTHMRQSTLQCAPGIQGGQKRLISHILGEEYLRELDGAKKKMDNQVPGGSPAFKKGKKNARKERIRTGIKTK